MELKLGAVSTMVLTAITLVAMNLVPSFRKSEAAEVTSVTTLTVAALSTDESKATTGSGFWLRLGCIGCGTGILLAGGSSLVGLAAIGGAFPHVLAGCATVCVAAFGADKLW